MKDKKKDYEDNKITGFFDKDTEFKGELSFKGSFRIDGHFKGTVNSESMLVVGEQGKVEADIKIGYIVISGEVKGTIRAAEKVEVHNTGRAIGTIITPKLIVQEGAYLEANCQAGEQAPVNLAETKNKEGSST
jgi:cytoskeletal protein CcmA (bactofilin family)